jgi:hypothetical protein
MFTAVRAAADNSWTLAKRANDVANNAVKVAMDARALARDARENSDWMEVMAAAAAAGARQQPQRLVGLIRPCAHHQFRNTRSRSRSRA